VAGDTWYSIMLWSRCRASPWQGVCLAVRDPGDVKSGSLTARPPKLRGCSSYNKKLWMLDLLRGATTLPA